MGWDLTVSFKHKLLDLNLRELVRYRREITRKLEEIIDFSEIGPHIDTPVKRYSSGIVYKAGFCYCRPS
jgi:ABC-type polysaccharide/polyol phosphate transport system ATPase subunit